MTGPARQAALEAFLRTAGLGAWQLSPLAGDASNRRYLRLRGPDGGPVRVLMDAPPEKGEDVRPFMAVTGWLRGLGLSAPEILASDPEAGFLVLEDLGDALFARVLAANEAPGPTEEATLYGAAVDLLAMLAETPAPDEIGAENIRHGLASYDAQALAREAALFTEWYFPAASAAPPSADLAAEYAALVAAATAPVAACRDVLVMRDYHAENLLWLPARRGHARVGLLDYQDALAGHAAYDLVSLLEDARRDTAPALQEAMISRYLDRRGVAGEAAQGFRAAYAALGAQRNLKIIGIFARLALRDGKPRYLSLIPRVWNHLMGDLAGPELAALGAWVACHVPPPSHAVLARIEAAMAARAS